jgi:hypothetical protein
VQLAQAWEKTQGRGKYASGSVFFGRVVVSFPAERAAGANRERSRAASPAPEVLIGAVLEVPASAPTPAPAPAPSSAPAPAPPGPPAPPPPCFLSCYCAVFPQSGPRALKRCYGTCLCCRGTCTRDTCLCCFRGALCLNVCTRYKQINKVQTSNIQSTSKTAKTSISRTSTSTAKTSTIAPLQRPRPALRKNSTIARQKTRRWRSWRTWRSWSRS